MMDFMEESREAFGVEPICRTLQFAPSTYYDRRTVARDPDRASARARSDASLPPRLAFLIAPRDRPEWVEYSRSLMPFIATPFSVQSNDIACFFVDQGRRTGERDCKRETAHSPGDHIMTAKTAAAAASASEALLLEIAAKHFRLQTLETRNSDGLDFHDVAVRSIRAAPRWKRPSPLAKPQPAEQETTP